MNSLVGAWRKGYGEDQVFLRDYLDRGNPEDIDPGDFSSYLYEWVEKEGIVGVDPEWGVENMTDGQVSEFKEWLIRNDIPSKMSHDDPYEAPAYTMMGFERLVKPDTWLIHFTDQDPTDIARHGFKYGADLEGLHLSTWRRNRLTPGEWGFAFEAPMSEWYGKKYGKHAVMFKSNQALVAHHYGDEEAQVVFKVGTDRDRVAIYGGDDGYDVMSRDGRRVLVKADSVEKAQAWVMQNYGQYRRVLSAWRRRAVQLASWWTPDAQKELDTARDNVKYIEEHPDSFSSAEKRDYLRDAERQEARYRAATGEGPSLVWDDGVWMFYGAVPRFYGFDRTPRRELLWFKRDLLATGLDLDTRVPSQVFYGSDASPRTLGSILADVDRRLEKMADA